MGRLQFAAQTAKPFRHEAFLYSGDEHYLAGTTAFVRGALEAGEAVLVAVAASRAALLRRALGRNASGVEFLDTAAMGRNPARIIPAWQDWIDRHSGAPGLRGIGELTWAGRTPSEIAECRRHERLLNTAFDDGPPWWLLCPYDVGTLPGPVVEHARASHPVILADDIRAPSDGYPCSGSGRPDGADEPLEEPPGPVVEFGFDLAGLGELRDRVAEFAEPVLGGRAAGDAVLVVSELAANSIKYGGGTGRLRLWLDGACVVCEVRDAGVITDPLAGRRRPSARTQGKAGLWMANQVCDLLQIRSAPGAGTVVRAHLGAGA